jgi:hypothetical protein
MSPKKNDHPHTEEVQRIFSKISKVEMEKIGQQAFEKAIHDWLDKKFAQFGRWTFGSIGAFLFAWLIKILVAVHFFQPLPTK